jgi:hypothetical protein
MSESQILNDERDRVLDVMNRNRALQLIEKAEDDQAQGYNEFKRMIEMKRPRWSIVSQFIPNLSRTQEIDVKCPAGHIVQKSYSSLNRQDTCRYCYSDRRRHNSENVEKDLLEKGLTLISEYVSIHDPIVVKCNQCHSQETIRYKNIKTKTSKYCKSCVLKRSASS